MRDEDLRSSRDYNEGQKEAAHRILIELVNLFDEYRDDIRIVGGWVPDLMFPDEGHIGSVDVDMLINHLNLKDAGYQTMSRILLKNGYTEHPDKFFSFVKRVTIDGIQYDVDVDILAGRYGGTSDEKGGQHIQGLKALKATGGNYAFEFEPQVIDVQAKRPDGAIDSARVNVVAIVPYIIMKTAALGRGKPKDAYDIYFLIKHYKNGVKELAQLFKECGEAKLIQEMKDKLSKKFGSPNHAGPVDVAAFMDLEDNDEIEFVKRDAYEQVQALIENI